MMIPQLKAESTTSHSTSNKDIPVQETFDLRQFQDSTTPLALDSRSPLLNRESDLLSSPSSSQSQLTARTPSPTESQRHVERNTTINQPLTAMRPLAGHWSTRSNFELFDNNVSRGRSPYVHGRQSPSSISTSVANSSPVRHEPSSEHIWSPALNRPPSYTSVDNTLPTILTGPLERHTGSPVSRLSTPQSLYESRPSTVAPSSRLGSPEVERMDEASVQPSSVHHFQSPFPLHMSSRTPYLCFRSCSRSQFRHSPPPNAIPRSSSPPCYYSPPCSLSPVTLASPVRATPMVFNSSNYLVRAPSPSPSPASITVTARTISPILIMPTPMVIPDSNHSRSQSPPPVPVTAVGPRTSFPVTTVPEAIPRESQRQCPHVNPPTSLYRMRHWDEEGTAAVTGAGTPIPLVPPPVQPGLPAPSNRLYDNTGINVGMGSSRKGYIVPHRASTPYSQFPHNSGSQGAVPWDSPVLPFIPPVIPPPLPDTPGIDSVSGVWPGPFPPFPPPFLPASSSFPPGFVQTGQIFGQPFGQWAGQPSGPSAMPNNTFSPQNLLKPHPRFYFADGGLTIRVTDTLYKIHSVFIQQHAPRLPPSIQHGTAAARYGASSHLQLYGVEPSQFDLVLSLFYPKSLLKHEPESVYEWLDVLHVSSTLHMPEIFSLAVFQLTLLASPVQKIEWGQRYNVKKWLVPAFMELVGRMEDINLEEKKKIGERGATMIQSLRQEMKGRVESFVVSGDV